MDVPIISVGCNIGAYNRNIDKRLARKLVWLREIAQNTELTIMAMLIIMCCH